DNIRGAVFQTRGLLLALEAGERRRVGRSLALEAIFRTSQSALGLRRAVPLAEAARRVAQETKDPYLAAWVGLADSFAAYCSGRFGEATDGLLGVEALVRSETVGTTWELNNARIFALQSLRYAGRWARLASHFHEWLRDARRRGDRYAETTLVRAMN